MRSALRSLLFALVIAGFLIWLAWQQPASFDLTIGGTIQVNQLGTREVIIDDAPYLFNMHDPEPAEITAETQQTFRWSEPQAEILVPHLNAGAMIARLHLAAPPRDATPLLLEVNTAIISTTLKPEPRILMIYAPPQPNGSLHLITRTPAYFAPNDERELGITLFDLNVQPTTWRWWISWTAWLQLMGVLVCVGVGAFLASLPPRGIFGFVLLVGSILALLLALLRTIITTDTARLLAAASAGLAVIIVGWFLNWLNPEKQTDALIVAGLTGLGFAIRLIGIRHPQTNFSDLLLNVNNLNSITQGHVLFTEGLPCEAGAGRAPYPPGFYIVLLPLTILVPEATKRGIVIQYGGALLDALIIPLIWWLVRNLHRESRASVWAAALYLIPLPTLRSMVVGEWSNVAGQAVGTGAMISTIVWVHNGMPRSWRPAIIVGLTIAALMHSGVLVAMGLWGLAWVFGLLMQRRWQTIKQLAIVASVALMLAGIIYYSVFLGDPSLAGNDPACPVKRPFMTKLAGVLSSLLKFDSQLPVWMGFIGLIGAIISRQRFPLALWAWLAVLPLSLLSLLFSEQTIRWWTFILPALCIGAGTSFDYLAQRNRRERWLALAITVFWLITSLVLALRFILTYRTGNFVP